MQAPCPLHPLLQIAADTVDDDDDDDDDGWELDGVHELHSAHIASGSITERRDEISFIVIQGFDATAARPTTARRAGCRLLAACWVLGAGCLSARCRVSPSDDTSDRSVLSPSIVVSSFVEPSSCRRSASIVDLDRVCCCIIRVVPRSAFLLQYRR